jgi:hypothetical protein
MPTGLQRRFSSSTSNRALRIRRRVIFRFGEVIGGRFLPSARQGRLPLPPPEGHPPDHPFFDFVEMAGWVGLPDEYARSSLKADG